MADGTKDTMLFSECFLKISIKDTGVVVAIIEKL